MNNQKTWFISGANNELGVSLVKQLLQLGHKVAATSPNIFDLMEAIGDNHPDFLPLQLNTSSDSAVAQVLKSVKEAFGRIDVVVNNGSYNTNRNIQLQLRNETCQHFEKNVFGMLHVVRRAVPYLQAQQSGHIINIVSDAGINAAIGWAPDAAAKHAVMGFSEVLCKEVSEWGGYVTVVTPQSFSYSLVPESLLISKRPLEAYEIVKSSPVKYLSRNPLQPTGTASVAKGIIETTCEAHPPLYLFVGNTPCRGREERLWKYAEAKDIKYLHAPLDLSVLPGSN